MPEAPKGDALDNGSNDAEEQLAHSRPYSALVTLEGTAAILFHRWSCEDVEAKQKAAKNSKAKKSDNVEAYISRTPEGEIAIPGEYLRQSIIHAAKYRQDPRSPRKSAMDMYKAGVVSLTELASLGTAKWDYLDQRRVTVQRSGVTRIRPAMLPGWRATFELQVLLPEYIGAQDLLSVITDAGRLIGLADFRPTYGRFQAIKYEVLNS